MGLVTATDVSAYRQVESVGDNGLLEALIAQVEAAFLRAVNRADRPFQPAESGRLEVLDGTGGPALFLAYPIQAVTAITLGYESPWDETLDPADPAVVVWAPGRRRLVRVDGGVFGCAGRPLYARVTYDAQADEPEDVKLAIVRVVDALWRESGSGEATSERDLPDAAELPLVADQDPFWRAAVDAHLEVTV
jgi:hypothetical protein